MRKYLYRFRNSLESELEYRSNMVSRSMVTLLKVASFFVLWVFVYSSTNVIGDFSFDQTLLYYTLIPLVGIITMASVDDLGRNITTGFVSNLLLKPYSIWIGALLDSVAVKLVTLTILGPIYLTIIVVLISRYNTPIDLSLLGIGILISVLAYLLNFFIELLVNFSAFWMEEVWAFRHVRNIIFGILGGLSFPFNFLSPSIRYIFELLPFKYIYYVPTSYALGKRGFDYFWYDIFGLAVWGLFFFFLARYLWKKGLKKYGAFGG